MHQWDYAGVAEVGVFLEAEIQMQVYVSQRRQHFPATWIESNRGMFTMPSIKEESKSVAECLVS